MPIPWMAGTPMLRFTRFLPALALASFCLPSAGRGQERTVVAKEIAVGRSEASLRLEFSSGAPLEIALRDGSVYIDGTSTGAYKSGDALDVAWRGLLGEAVALDDGALARKLQAWSPPASLTGDRLALATDIDHRLQSALSVPAKTATPNVSVSTGGDDASLVKALLGHAGRLATLEEALKGSGTNFKLHVDEDVDVGVGDKVDGTLVVVQGDARISGEIDGDVVVVDGTLTLADGGKVSGDIRLANATLKRDGGSVDGEVVNVQSSERDLEREVRDRVSEEMRSERGTKARGTAASGFFSPLRNIFRGLGGLMENLVSIVVLGLLGMGVVAFAPKNLDIVAETARLDPGRAALVGVAGTFLLIPVWVLGAVALAISIVGIPVMIAWLPIFPLAAVAAALLGYLAVARNLGEWLADSGYRYTDWIRKSNPVHTIVGGVAGLSVFFLVGNVLRMVPFFGFFRGLLVVGGVLASTAAVMIGFGAVLLTRAGRRPEYGPIDFDEAWHRSVGDHPDLGDDPNLDHPDLDAAASNPHTGQDDASKGEGNV